MAREARGARHVAGPSAAGHRQQRLELAAQLVGFLSKQTNVLTLKDSFSAVSKRKKRRKRRKKERKRE